MSAVNEQELIELDYDGITDTDIRVILWMTPGESISPSRLQRLDLLYRNLYIGPEGAE